MNLNDIVRIRLNNQQVENTLLKTPKSVVSWMGAIQAQDYPMAKWAVGIRSSSAEQAVEEALNKGEIIRTHVLRPTWHLAAAADIRWMLMLTAPAIKRQIASYARKLEADDNILKRCNIIIEKALRGHQHLTRTELMMILNKKGIVTNDFRSALIMMSAELDAIVCNGSMKGKEFTYALMDEKIPAVKKLKKDEALAALADRYFKSHGPATLKDFIWWSGLAVADAKTALELVKSNFISETIGLETYWFSSGLTPAIKKSSLYLLPAFDEFLISYKDRAAAISADHQKKAFTANGIFKPIIVKNGIVTGVWRRTVKKNDLLIEIELFHPQDKTTISQIENSAKAFGNFLNKKAELKFV